MARFLASLRAFLILCGLASALVLGGCQDKKASSGEPTQPWRRDEVEASQRQISRIDYAISASSQLSLSLPTKRTKPEGTLRGISGKISLDPSQLQFVQGSIRFDLHRIELNESLKPPDQMSLPAHRRQVTPELEAELLKSSWTTQAKNWLGIGERSPESQENAQAEFTIESARDLSHPRSEAGAHREVDADHARFKQARLVDATVVGTLTMRHLSVARSVPVRILFYYRDLEVRRETPPDLIEVSLRGRLDVPLLEYDIKPRDEEGHALSEQSSLLGYWVGNSTRLTGSIQLEKVAL